MPSKVPGRTGFCGQSRRNWEGVETVLAEAKISVEKYFYVNVTKRNQKLWGLLWNKASNGLESDRFAFVFEVLVRWSDILNLVSSYCNTSKVEASKNRFRNENLPHYCISTYKSYIQLIFFLSVIITFYQTLLQYLKNINIKFLILQ